MFQLHYIVIARPPPLSARPLLFFACTSIPGDSRVVYSRWLLDFQVLQRSAMDHLVVLDDPDTFTPARTLLTNQFGHDAVNTGRAIKEPDEMVSRARIVLGKEPICAREPYMDGGEERGSSAVALNHGNLHVFLLGHIASLTRPSD